MLYAVARGLLNEHLGFPIRDAHVFVFIVAALLLLMVAGHADSYHRSQEQKYLNHEDGLSDSFVVFCLPLRNAPQQGQI